jgi:two-component system response regulator CpxR
MKRILMIADDEKLCAAIKEFLEPEGFELVAVAQGEKGLQLALAASFCLVILDLHLPHINGLELLRDFRIQSDLPVLILTAAEDLVDRILGLEFGADDYLTKPFDKRDLLAHIRAILRYLRNIPSSEQSSDEPATLSKAGLFLDKSTWTVKLSEKAIPLTAIEFNLLAMLMQEAGKVVNRDQLAAAVLGRPYDPLDRSIDMHISKLRRKLGQTSNGMERIKTFRGAGYCLIHPSSPPER